MNQLKKMHLLSIILSVLAAFLLIAGCATTEKPSEKACKPDIEWEVTTKAQVTQLDCEIGTHKKKPSLIFTVSVKNVTDKPLRYRVNIFLLDLGKAAGHLVPRKGKPPVLEPGNTKIVKIPFIKTTDVPEKVLVVVETIGY